MGTRAVIRVEGLNACELYKHWDGGPESTEPWLNAFNKEFKDARGDDATYKFAALVRSSVFRAKEFNLDDSEFTGWGVSKQGENSWNYLYVLKKDGTVTYFAG